MRVVIQRVTDAEVQIDQAMKARIAHGLLIFAGFEEADNADDIDWTVRKIAQLRIFDDEQGIMNRSVTDIRGELLVVSQFTLHASTKKGNRPSYCKAAGPGVAIPLYESFCARLAGFSGLPVQTGIFGAQMLVGLKNDGPVTIIIDSKNKE